MEQLDDILRSATTAIGHEYFQLPIAGREPALYERVYCYELYHQMRCRWPEDTNLVLSGEIPKRGHEIIMEMIENPVIPDFLIHVPGSMEHNYAIMEIKSSRAVGAGIVKDLATLDQFRVNVGYHRAIYLFYGGVDEELVRELAAARPLAAPVEIWLHSEQGVAARLVWVAGPH
jgi:hypothetical protein